MATQLCKVVRGFWHLGEPRGDGEELEIEANTASMLKGNGNVVFIKERTPMSLIAPAPESASASIKGPRKGGAA